jgi:hypothetical protein
MKDQPIASRPAQDRQYPEPSPAATWFLLAFHPATVRRALITALIVGTILIVINQGDAILRGHISHLHIAKMILTVMVPYLVSTVSSVSTRMELRKHG